MAAAPRASPLPRRAAALVPLPGVWLRVRRQSDGVGGRLVDVHVAVEVVDMRLPRRPRPRQARVAVAVLAGEVEQRRRRVLRERGGG